MTTQAKVFSIGSVTRVTGIVVVGAWISLASCLADSASVDVFEKQIRPLLVEHCYECHSQSAGKSKGGLLLDSKSGWEQGGDSGPAIVPGAPEQSLLFKAVRYDDPDLAMPPDGKLTDHQITALKKWIQLGAADPRQGVGQQAAKEIDIDAARNYWAFQPPSLPALPEVANPEWARDEIDHFTLAKMEAAGITPVSPADDRDLIRRLYFDLTGLPPTPAQLASELANPSPTSVAELVDRLLASDRFGETWGRHWLDLARYSESTGGGRSALLPTAWRYRNYAIDAYNQDKPYDEFVREQLAGDLLPAATNAERKENLIATAFLVLGPKNLDLQDKELLRMNTVDEQIDTVTRVFMGLTVSCARCHDHKFDPIPTKDYYAMAGIFRSTRTLNRSNVSTLTERELPTSDVHRKTVAEFLRTKKDLQTELNTLKKTKPKSAELAERLKHVERQLAEHDQAAPPPLPKTLGVSDEADPDDYFVCIRGNVHQPGQDVQRGFLEVLSPPRPEAPKIAANESGRRELAHWITQHDHPLVARVYVNRIWQHLFGSGLVRTADNFGQQGERPSHPELLDFLAVRFIQDGWSTKRLIRRLVLSQTYQLSTQQSPANNNIDADNRLRWRMPRKHLTAEAVRDAILSISGTLQERRVECLFPEAAQNDTALQKVSLDVARLVNPPLRSVYIPVLREEGLNPLLKAFDFANPSFPVGKRNQSILPTQALFLMNSEFVMNEAAKAAERLLTAHPTTDDPTLLVHLYLQTTGREPTPGEQKAALEFLELATNHNRNEIWGQLYHSLFASVDFRYLK